MSNIYVANWKMNKTLSEAKEYMLQFLPKVKNCKNEIIICANAICLDVISKLAKKSNVQIAGQNFYPEDSGAFTGEISPQMLKEIGVNIIMLGHSERRIYFQETDEFINRKILKAVEDGFKIIFCIGENQQERDTKKTLGVLNRQIKVGLSGVTEENIKNIYIAYEPIWSISTFSMGRTATFDEIREVHCDIRNILKDLYPTNYADVKILYGGSVNSKNIKDIMTIENVDGALIGGASLEVESLVEVCENE